MCVCVADLSGPFLTLLSNKQFPEFVILECEASPLPPFLQMIYLLNLRINQQMDYWFSFAFSHMRRQDFIYLKRPLASQRTVLLFYSP